jgi:transposase
MIQDLKRFKRWSILPAFTVDGYIAWEVHQGSITAVIFNDFVRNQVLPHCISAANGGPRSVLVLDNARIHWNVELIEMCEEVGVTLARLPPYSPDFNPIETSFALLKAWIRRNGETSLSYTEEYGGFGQFLRDAVKENRRLGLGDPGTLFRAAGIQYPTIDL